MADSLTRFARGLGMARSGDLAGAKREVQALQELRSALEQSSQPYWADRTQEQILAVAAWVAYAEGARDQATKLMRAAADGEDGSVKHVAMENRLYPMRELLGELLLQIGQPAAALGEFEASLKENRNRYRSLSGAARAAEAAGDRQKAVGYFEKLVALTVKRANVQNVLPHGAVPVTSQAVEAAVVPGASTRSTRTATRRLSVPPPRRSPLTGATSS